MSKSKEEKEFSLKNIEIQMIQNMHDRANQQLFDFFSFIALERLAYTPTKGTQFRVDNGKLYISEVEVKEDEEVATA